MSLDDEAGYQRVGDLGHPGGELGPGVREQVTERRGCSSELASRRASVALGTGGSLAPSCLATAPVESVHSRPARTRRISSRDSHAGDVHAGPRRDGALRGTNAADDSPSGTSAATTCSRSLNCPPHISTVVILTSHFQATPVTCAIVSG